MPWHHLAYRSTKAQQLENPFLQTCQQWEKVNVPIQTSSQLQTFEKCVAEGEWSNFLRCDTFESPLTLVCYRYFSDDCSCHFWFLVIGAHAPSLWLPVKSPSSVVDWEPDWPGIKIKKTTKKNMLTLSTDLEHRSITDMAAVQWQATEAAAPVRSSGQMAVVNAEAQSVDVIHSTSMHKDNFAGLCRSPQRSQRVTKALFFIKWTSS